jgi:hypothetical protein
MDGISLVPVMLDPNSTTAFSKNYTLTQFPRCHLNNSLPLWKFNDCDDINRTNFTHMGLSIRSDRWRFTRWYTWVGNTLKPNWTNPIGDELYDHQGDDGMDLNSGHEAVNKAAGFPSVVGAMVAQLENAFRRDARS